MSRLATFLSEQRRRLTDCDRTVLAERHESFVRGLAALESEWTAAAGALLPAHADFFRACQRRYLRFREDEALAQMLAGAADLAPNVGSRRPTRFAAAAYDRICDLARLIDLRRCARAVVVGCGSLPATLLWLHDRAGIAGVGVDTEPVCVEGAARLAAALGLDALELACADGRTLDYGGFDLVYVTNQVSPKAEVVARVTATAAPGAQIVVRDPYGPGALLAEPVRDALPAGVAIAGEGGRSATFLSLDLALRLPHR